MIDTMQRQIKLLSDITENLNKMVEKLAKVVDDHEQRLIDLEKADLKRHAGYPGYD